MNSSVDQLFGNTHLRYLALSSTNQRASLLLSKTRPRHGTVISALFQRSGLGQIGRAWHSESGKNLLFSIILYPQIPADQQFRLSMAVALAIHQALSDMLNIPVAIKWPNDIYIGHDKIGGILLQNTISGKRIQHTIAGIGVNVNQGTFPGDIPNPTSLYLATGEHYDPDAVLHAILTRLETTYDLASSGDPSLRASYLAALYQRGVPTRYIRIADGAEITGVIEDVDTNGKLLLRTGGARVAFGFNELRMIVP